MRTMVYKSRGLVFCFFSFIFLSGLFGSKHSSLETKIKTAEQNLTVDFIVKPNKGHKITHEGPWSLTVTDAKNLQLELSEKGQWQTEDFKDKLPGFQMSAPIQKDSKSGSFDYVLRAFVCTENEDRCYPQVHRGTINWEI